MTFEDDVNHCKDCCCARSWKALGVTEYDGKSIPEHISWLRLDRDGHQKIAEAVMDKRDALAEALRQLYHECLEAGHDRDKDFNWPKAMADACSALQNEPKS